MESDVSLRDYIEARLKNLEDKLDSQSQFMAQHFMLNELAIKKADESMSTRLDNMNEFIEQIKEERGNYVTREMLNLIVKEREEKFKVVNDNITKLEKVNEFSSGKMWMVMALFAAIPTVLALLALWNR